MQQLRNRIDAARAARFASGLRLQQARLGRPFANALQVFFTQQANRALAIYNDRVPEQRAAEPDVELKNTNPNQLIPSRDDIRLLQVSRPFVVQMLMVSSARAGRMVGVAGLVSTDPALVALGLASGTRIRAINDATRDAVQRILADSFARGLSQREIGQRIHQVVQETYTGRAATIARTELATASQAAAAERYGAAGVTLVDITDGPDCGWTSHDDPDKANGTRRTLADARAHPLAHPNCRRVTIPVVPE